MTVKSAQLTRVSDAFLKCRSRTWGHMWEDIPRPATRHNWDLKPDVMLRCVRCSTEKFLWLNAEGQIVGTPQYDYAEGYNLKGLYQGDKLTVAELRAEIVSRHRKGRKLKSVK